jgi:hypothetical protein
LAVLLHVGIALLDDRFDLEQYDELGRWLVLLNGLGTVYSGKPLLPTARAWFLVLTWRSLLHRRIKVG